MNSYEALKSEYARMLAANGEFRRRLALTLFGINEPLPDDEFLRMVDEHAKRSKQMRECLLECSKKMGLALGAQIDMEK